MGEQIVFREMRPGEEEAVCEMVIHCFNEFIGPRYSVEGIEEFRRYVDPSFLKDRIEQGNIVGIALDGDGIAGMIEVRIPNHISLLFVRKDCHRRGIARKLVEQGIEQCKLLSPSIDTIDVNSSPYAVRIYEHMGFAKIDTEQIKNGIRFIPMRLELNT